MKTDPRTLERRIIEKDRRYLWGAKDGAPVWVPSPYDAWWDQENSGANVLMVAKEIGGTVRTFNPLTGELKDMTIEKTAAVLHELSEAWYEGVEDQLTDSPRVMLTEDAAQAIHDAAYLLDSMRIMLGMFKDPGADIGEAET